MKLINQLWVFFASVKLAIFTLCVLATTSIIGTIVPQGETSAFYVKRFGAKTAMFFQILDLHTMYSSWWFSGLLGLLSANLIICSLDRFPTVWRLITADNLAVSPERLEKMANVRQWQISSAQSGDIAWQAVLAKDGWPTGSRQDESGKLFFSQKGRWSRTGVYLVHLSILVIFVGAIIGHFLGFKANVMLPELRSTDKVYGAGKEAPPIELGFTVRCDSFGIEFYDNGMPKEYRSSLTILENGQEILQKDIRVNSPLSYKGITFYQSSYQGFQEFIFQVTEAATGDKKEFVLPFQQQMSWDAKGLHFGIVNADAVGQRSVRAKVWFKAGDDPAIVQWLADNDSISVSSGGKAYTLSAKQRYATGLQIAKDPGVWVVYIGCGLLLLGLYMAFFMAHRRIWLYQRTSPAGPVLLLAGSANKNKTAFAKQFTQIENRINQAIQVHDNAVR
jgi:cytochrome c biogenesis protein